MNFRAVTLGFTPSTSKQNDLDNIYSFFTKFHSIFPNYYIHTKRLTVPTIRLEHILSSQINDCYSQIFELCNRSNIRWFCLPFIPTKSTSNNDYNQLLHICLKEKVFINLLATHNNNSILCDKIPLMSEFIKNASKISSNGYQNFKIGVSCNCSSNFPFFPFSYHGHTQNGFSLALELIPLFINTIKQYPNSSLLKIKEILIKNLSSELLTINTLAKQIEQDTGFSYFGVDAAIAPFPNKEHSIMNIFSLLDTKAFGDYSTLFLTSFLTDIIKTSIKQTKIQSIGFNGVMFSILEDNGLAESDSNLFSIDSLMLYSSVCGCGIDMVPVPENISINEIGKIILDVSALSIVLKKPLGVRLLPIPNKQAHEVTNINHDFICNSYIKNIKNGCNNKRIFQNVYKYF